MDGGMYHETDDEGLGLNLQQHVLLHVQTKLQDTPEQQQQDIDERVDQEQQHGCETSLPMQQLHQHQQHKHAQQPQLVQQQQKQQSVSISLAQHDRQLYPPQQQQRGQPTVPGHEHDEVVSQQESSQLANDTCDPEGTTSWEQCSSCHMPIPGYMFQKHLAACQAPRDRKDSGTDLRGCNDSPSVLVCSISSKRIPDQESILEHEQSHRGQEANRHRATDSHPGSIYMCSVCCLRFPTTEELVKHVEVHLKGEREEGSCQVCSEVFQNPLNLLQHMETHHGHLKACPCGAVFPNKQEFREHQDVCMPVLRDPTAATNSAKSYRCRLCPKIFGTVQSRLQHERVHRRSNDANQMTSEKFVNKTEFVCNLCKQEFNCRENFRAHVRSHTGEKPYGCRHCLKSFSSLQGRWQHEKIHKR